MLLARIRTFQQGVPAYDADDRLCALCADRCPSEDELKTAFEDELGDLALCEEDSLVHHKNAAR